MANYPDPPRVVTHEHLQKCLDAYEKAVGELIGKRFREIEIKLNERIARIEERLALAEELTARIRERAVVAEVRRHLERPIKRPLGKVRK